MGALNLDGDAKKEMKASSKKGDWQRGMNTGLVTRQT